MVTPIAFGISMIFDHKNFKADMIAFKDYIKTGGIKRSFKNFKERIVAIVKVPNPNI